MTKIHSAAIPARNSNQLKLGIICLFSFSVIALFLGLFVPLFFNAGLIISICFLIVASFLFFYQYIQHQKYRPTNTGIMLQSLTNKGFVAYSVGFILTAFYVLIYWYPYLLGYNATGNTGLVRMFNPLSYLLNGKAATQWFMYGTIYTLAIFIFGIKFIIKYRHVNYQVVRTISVMFFQLAFAFLLPELLQKFNPNQAYFAKDLKNMWPLNYYFFEDWHINALLSGHNLGAFMLIMGIAMIFVVSPILTYYFGKRWYCSWVCGCGGLAETAGDSFRQLSNKSVTAWRLERWVIHLVLVFIILVTIAVLFSLFYNNPTTYWLNKYSFSAIVIILSIGTAALLFAKRKKLINTLTRQARYVGTGVVLFIVVCLVHILLSGGSNIFWVDAYKLRQFYGFFIGAMFSGVIGVGFYPLLGSRVWCRFGCPMAALLGLQQKLFSKFRITTNSGQCISCGNCSTYCEMGIDVRSYAQQGLPIVRSSCVGCGICSAVCPRGVLKLENVSIADKYNTSPISVNSNGIIVNH